jgi:hypothetical protein
MIHVVEAHRMYHRKILLDDFLQRDKLRGVADGTNH